MECLIPTLFFFGGWTKKGKKKLRAKKIKLSTRRRRNLFFLEMVSGALEEFSAAAHQFPFNRPVEIRRKTSSPPLFNPDRPRGVLTKFIKALRGSFSFVLCHNFLTLSLTNSLPPKRKRSEGEYNDQKLLCSLTLFCVCNTHTHASCGTAHQTFYICHAFRSGWTPIGMEQNNAGKGTNDNLEIAWLQTNCWLLNPQWQLTQKSFFEKVPTQR